MGMVDRKILAKYRAERIRSSIPIVDVLLHYGYYLHSDAGDREQQFSCDLHGSVDHRESARVYPDSASWYCFACGTVRDAIRTVQDKEGLNFSQACYTLEERHRISHPDYSEFAEESAGEVLQARKKAEELTASFEEERRQTERMLLYLTQERTLQLTLSVSLWEVYDQVVWRVEKEEWKESFGVESLAKIRQRAIKLGAEALQGI